MSLLRINHFHIISLFLLKTANKTYNQNKDLGIELINVDTYAKETITEQISELTTDLSTTK